MTLWTHELRLLLRELLGRPVRPCADATARAHLLVGVVHRDRRAEVDHLRTIAANCAYDLGEFTYRRRSPSCSA